MGNEGGTKWNDWANGGYRGPPPWRRGFPPMYLLTSLAVFAGSLILIWLFASGRLP